MRRLTGTIPPGAHRRLTEHYGSDVVGWLSEAERLFADAAGRWNLDLTGFHDAGWTSVVAFGHTRDDQPVVLKAMPDIDRFQLEQAALAHWDGDGVCRLLETDEHDQILMVSAVGGQVGGCRPPDDHTQRVAAAIPRLHRERAVGDSVPLVHDYYRETVVPRIRRRAHRFADVLGASRVSCVLSLCQELVSSSTTRVMLHSDLYAENVLFDRERAPVFIDPHAKIGPPAFDWAFWCVYYTPSAGFAERVALCAEHVPTLVDEVLAWSATLAMDGALYYLDTDDSTAAAMIDDLNHPLLASIVDG